MNAKVNNFPQKRKPIDTDYHSYGQPKRLLDCFDPRTSALIEIAAREARQRGPEQLSIAFDATARNTDPQSSHDAAAALTTSRLSHLQQTVMDYLRSVGARGATVPEIVAATGAPLVSISPRLRPLKNAGLVIQTKERRIPDGRRVGCIVWRVA